MVCHFPNLTFVLINAQNMIFVDGKRRQQHSHLSLPSLSFLLVLTMTNPKLAYRILKTARRTTRSSSYPSWPPSLWWPRGGVGSKTLSPFYFLFMNIRIVSTTLCLELPLTRNGSWEALMWSIILKNYRNLLYLTRDKTLTHQ